MDISLSTLNHSPKKNGRYEEVLIDRIFNYYKERRYNIRKHVAFNIAWGSVISEIDLILQNYNEITIFEIKSKQDKIQKAHIQIEKFKKYADYIYIVSDSLIDRNMFEEEIGLIYINRNIDILREAKKIFYNIEDKDLKKLKKACLFKLINSDVNKEKTNKNKIIDMIMKKYSQEKINRLFREIAFCSTSCDLCTIDE